MTRSSVFVCHNCLPPTTYSLTARFFIIKGRIGIDKSDDDDDDFEADPPGMTHTEPHRPQSASGKLVTVVNHRKSKKGKNGLSAEEAAQLDRLLSATRAAVNEITPVDPPRIPFLYWSSGRDPKSKLSAIKLLMKQHPDFAVEAQKYGTPKDYMEKFAPSVRIQANNERSTQIRAMKHTWSAKAPPHCFDHGCLDF